MVDIKESAVNFVSKKTKNIADLDKVPVNMELFNKVVNQGTVDEFSYNYIMVNDEEYRVPAIVLKQLQAQISENPDIEFFKVKKTGTTKNDTVYTVIITK